MALELGRPPPGGASDPHDHPDLPNPLDQPAGPAQQLLEIVTPRTNAATITPAENFFAAVSLPEPFALEIAATRTARWFVVRAGSAGMRRHLEEQLAAAYPQASVRALDAGRVPGIDPARCRSDEQVAAVALTLREPPYLPLRTFRDADLAAALRPALDLGGRAARW
jgi:hypothetical protein